MKISQAEKLLRYVNRFLYTYAPSNLTESEGTLKNYRIALDSYLEWLETEKKIDDCSLSIHSFEAKMLEEWIMWLKTIKNNSNSSCNIKLSSMRTFLKYLSKQEAAYRYIYVEAQTIARQRVKKTKEEPMSRDAITAMFNVPNTKTVSGRRYYVMMILFYSLGVRIDELLSLTISNTHLSEKISYITVTGKGGKKRTLTLLSEPQKLLSAYIQSAHGPSPDPNAYVFYTNHKGKYMKMSQNAVRKQLKSYAIIAKKKCPDVPLHIHPHLFRRSKANHLIDDGINVMQVSEFLGHENVSTTMIYLNISYNQKNNALATIEDEYDSTLTKKWKEKKGSLRDIAGTRNSPDQK